MQQSPDMVKQERVITGVIRAGSTDSYSGTSGWTALEDEDRRPREGFMIPLWDKRKNLLHNSHIYQIFMLFKHKTCNSTWLVVNFWA